MTNIDNEVLRNEMIDEEVEKECTLQIIYDIEDESDDAEFIKNLLLEQKRTNK